MVGFIVDAGGDYWKGVSVGGRFGRLWFRFFCRLRDVRFRVFEFVSTKSFSVSFWFISWFCICSLVGFARRFFTTGFKLFVKYYGRGNEIFLRSFGEIEL